MGQAPHEAFPGDADDVERRPCPRCKAAPGSPCRSRSGAVASTHHSGRFTKAHCITGSLPCP
ncbi:zinc finger domain-containing protein [Streptomyces malaysiensis]|uniref:zinc finger domain-containing protein n=1 Tax=Streptomyces TaxID=1883 RepID=UPI003CCE3A1A